MSRSSLRHVFVYGTLRRGEVNDITRLRPTPRYAGPASVNGTLFDLGAYPGLRLGGSGLVHGEVYAISAELERQLDVIEEVAPRPNGEYTRREIQLCVAGRSLLCLVYEINLQHVQGRAPIDGGDWLHHRAGLA